MEQPLNRREFGAACAGVTAGMTGLNADVPFDEEAYLVNLIKGWHLNERIYNNFLKMSVGELQIHDRPYDHTSGIQEILCRVLYARGLLPSADSYQQIRPEQWRTWQLLENALRKERPCALSHSERLWEGNMFHQRNAVVAEIMQRVIAHKNEGTVSQDS